MQRTNWGGDLLAQSKRLELPKRRGVRSDSVLSESETEKEEEKLRKNPKGEMNLFENECAHVSSCIGTRRNRPPFRVNDFEGKLKAS